MKLTAVALFFLWEFMGAALAQPSPTPGVRFDNPPVTAGHCVSVGTASGTIHDTGGTCVATGSYLPLSGGTLTGPLTDNLNAASLPATQAGTVVRIGNLDGTASRFEADGFASAGFFTAVRYDGTAASPTTLQLGNEMGGFNAWGYNGTTVSGPRASFRTFAAENWTGTAQGTYADIATTPAGTTALASVLHFDQDAGMWTPSATGGDKGPGTINAQGLFVNGTAVSVATVPAAGLVKSTGSAFGDATVSAPLAFNSGTGTLSLNQSGAGLVTSDGVGGLGVAIVNSPLGYTTGPRNLTCTGCLTANQTITLTGAVTGSGTTSIATTYAGTVAIANGGTGQTTAALARIAINQGSSSPSTGTSTITPDCAANSVQKITLTTGTGPYTVANCTGASNIGATFILIFVQPASGAAQTVTSWGTLYRFAAPSSNASPPALTASLNAIDVFTCVQYTATRVACTFSANFT